MCTFPSWKGLKVLGDLDLRGSNVESLPEGLKVGGNLDLIGSKVEVLPKKFEVGGKIYGLDSFFP